MSYYEFEAKNFERVMQTIESSINGKEAEKIINNYLAGEGGETIKDRIQQILPVSGRTWTGKIPAAKSAEPFRKTAGNLAVKIHTKSPYHYLYFPDDGSNTDNHYGNQQFMLHGAEASEEEIADKIIEKILQRMEEM